MFTRRNEPTTDGKAGLQDVLMDALRDRGGQVVIYGDTGVGKSSILRHAAEDESMKTVTVECLSNKSYDELIDDAIKKIVDIRELTRTRSSSVSTEVEGETTMVPFLVSLRGRIRGERNRTRNFEVVQKAPLDALVEAMKATKTQLLVLDNFQNIPPGASRKLVAETMESLSDRSSETGDIKVVVIGIAEDAATLVSNSGSFRRRITEVGVPRMPDDEIEEVLEKGFGLLGLSIPARTLSTLVFYSDGFPYFAHLLGLNIARVMRRAEATYILEEHVAVALSSAVDSVRQSFEERLSKAFEASGNTQPRRRILEIMAEAEDRKEWQGSDVVTAYEKKYEARSEYQFLYSALGALVDEQHGAVLRRKGQRTQYSYQFSDPYLRPYLRITKRERPEG